MQKLDKEIEKLLSVSGNNLPSMDKMAKITASSLDLAASQAAFKIFKDYEYRKLIKLDRLATVEQDRIFNELVLATIVLVMLTLEANDLRASEEIKQYYLIIKEKMNQAHIDQLKECGVEGRFLSDWKKLINMRYKEYIGEKHKAREASMQVESVHKGSDLDIDDLKNIQLMLPLQIVAIGAHRHICRGKTKGYDEAFKKLIKLLGQFYIEMRVPLEGGKITPMKRFLVKTKKFLNKVIQKF